MKTKIIYISGGEVFEMAQIRAAFEEVKTTLGLDKDTILFGVPVDCDNAIEVDTEKTQQTVNVIPEPVSETITEISENPENTEYLSDSEVYEELPAETSVDVVDEEVVAEETPVVPILSVLALNEEEQTIESFTEKTETEEVVETVVDITETVDDIVEPVAEEKQVTEEASIVSEVVSVDDIADDDVPDMPMEKTLEQLLESMTPLREDVVVKEEDIVESENTFEDTAVLDTSDTDATLAQLASEFALTEDKIAPAPRAETSGKIGKLKNILPFKKAKREANSLMGDLFGWAGIAANDEDCSIPGFITPATKQGA
jgi:hypothetical protein